MKLAVTGGTGFVGSRLIERALVAGHQVRALTRQPQPARDGVEWIAGDLADPGALCDGADAVIHVAGVVNARDRAGFAAGNIAGTDAIVAAAHAAKIERFVHVSSLAAREPDLSNYGWSKAEAERIVRDSALAWTIVRPPAVYGPGDLEMRDLFKLATRGLALTPPPGQLSLIHVDDLARLLLACVESEASEQTFEPEDASGGIDHAAFARLIGDAVGRRVRPIALPRLMLSLAARTDRLVRGKRAKLTPDRAAYLGHPDWTADPAKAPPATLWSPKISTAQGLAETAAWYRAKGLLG